MNRMDSVRSAVISGILIILIIAGLSYFIDGNIDWVVAIGTAIGFSIASFIFNRRKPGSKKLNPEETSSPKK